MWDFPFSSYPDWRSQEIFDRGSEQAGRRMSEQLRDEAIDVRIAKLEAEVRFLKETIARLVDSPLA